MNKLLVPLMTLVFAGCCCVCENKGYPSAIEEGFVPCADGTAVESAWESGRDFVARFEYLPSKGGENRRAARVLPAASDNVDKQIWGKEKNFAPNGSYERKAGMWNFEEVKVAGDEIEVLLNGYVVAKEKVPLADRKGVRWIGFTGTETLRNIRIRKDAVLVPGMKAPCGFETYFNGCPKQLAANWKGVTTEEEFDNPVVRQTATPEKRALMQKIADLGMTQHWTVRDGSLHFDGFRGGYSLATKKDYADFELWADWRILSITGDSGLYLRGSPQVQIWDAHNQWHIGSGGLYNNQKNPHDALKIADRQVGDWNRFHVIMRGEKVTVWLNGELVVDNVTLENYWDRSQPIFPKEQIELQCHGDPTEGRNVFIREL